MRDNDLSYSIDVYANHRLVVIQCPAEMIYIVPNTHRSKLVAVLAGKSQWCERLDCLICRRRSLRIFSRIVRLLVLIWLGFFSRFCQRLSWLPVQRLTSRHPPPDLLTFFSPSRNHHRVGETRGEKNVLYSVVFSFSFWLVSFSISFESTQRGHKRTGFVVLLVFYVVGWSGGDCL